MPATNSTHRFHSWSHTGGLGVPQPDNREETQLHGDTEACMAVLNNYYGDGGWTLACDPWTLIVTKPAHCRKIL